MTIAPLQFITLCNYEMFVMLYDCTCDYIFPNYKLRFVGCVRVAVAFTPNHQMDQDSVLTKHVFVLAFTFD